MPVRQPLEETRALLLDAGARMLMESGVNVTIAKFAMIDVCRRAGLTTAGSAYKIWKNQDEFRHDLLQHLLATTFHPDAAFAQVQELTTPSPTISISEVIRLVSAQNLADNADPSNFLTYVALWIASEHDAQLAEQLLAHDRGSLQDFANLYESAVELFGREWVSPFTPEHLAFALSSLVKGFVLRSITTPDLTPMVVMRATGPNGQDQPWHLFACGVQAIVETFTRPKLT